VLRGIIFPFSDLVSAWPNYRNSPIFVEEQNKKFEFVLQCYKISKGTYLPSAQN